MAISMRLEVRQAQSLALTPQLLQSIRLLRLDHVELAEFLAREAERNPLIRLSEPRRAASRASAGFAPEAGAPERPSLHAHAAGEIADILRCPLDRAFAQAMLVDLDEAGYLRADPVASAARLETTPARIGAILRALRAAAEPAGLFAGDLAECLSLQLQRRGRLDAAFGAILSRLDLLARGDLPALARLAGCEAAGISSRLAEIRRLEPRPGRAFEACGGAIPEPDILVARERSGGWRVALNAGAVPRLLLDEDYARTVGRGAKEAAYLAECRAQASWLMRALDQRARSVLKVASQIMRVQEGFLEEGAGALAPMTLAGIAEAVSLHESSVSRIVAGKTVETPRGLFELKFFLSASLASSNGGGEHSATSVRERIRRLVAAEAGEGAGAAILSDEEIARRLSGDGVRVARRTVAKYREALGIPSSARRRRDVGLASMAS